MNQASPFKLARRAVAMNPSMIREILKLTEKGGVISFAGGLPSPRAFPVEAMREACEHVLRDHPREALQYSASEGSTVLVESPTCLGALQAFTPMQPHYAGVAGDDEGPLPEAMAAAANGVDARFFYLLPNFQNPTGRSISDARRAALVERAAAIGLPLVEDNPYGDLWFDAPPPPSLAGRNPDGAVYLGSFSKVLAPGLRLGYVVAPSALMPKLLQAKQAADLHTPSLNQRIVYEVIRNGFLDRHVPTIRALYKAQRDAMLAALERHMPEGVHWNRPAGGMFLWVELPASMNATGLLPFAVERGVAFVPGAPFFSSAPQANTLRLSFVTASEAQIETGIAALGEAIRAAQQEAKQRAASR